LGRGKSVQGEKGQGVTQRGHVRKRLGGLGWGVNPQLKGKKRNGVNRIRGKHRRSDDKNEETKC